MNNTYFFYFILFDDKYVLKKYVELEQILDNHFCLF